MVRTKWLRRAAIGALLVLPILTAGCGIFSRQTDGAIDPPQNGSGVTDEGTKTGQAATSEQGDGSHLTVYLKDRNGYLAPVALRTTFGKNEEPGQKALEMMVNGGAYASQIPEDFSAVLPEGTQVNSFHVDKDSKIATVDFSEPFSGYTATEERSIVEAITWTLTAIQGIEGVEVWSEGEKLTEMPVDSFPLDEPLTRAVGINLEAADGVNYSDSTPVTLYFSSQTSNDEQYYVPVTRLIARPQTTKAQAALEQLIAGPLDRKQLSAVITDDVKVTSVQEKDHILTVDLKDDAYERGQAAPKEMLEALVLSLTETTSADKVQILLNGDSNIVDSEDNSYQEPASRPHHVNAIKS
ncbi:GerMN domain-containing protein [Paenibacillus sp. NPDC058071]|uniref:GerMN domain-containing protein n=1 Tax=Paenibacillus sp. NPDC058071 TaxID=3346326 RepID=UPI0036D7AC5D